MATKYYTYKKTAQAAATKTGGIVKFAAKHGYYVVPKPKPPALIKPSADLASVRNHLIIASDSYEALDTARWWKLTITADLGYRHHYDEIWFSHAKSQGREINVWCDCRPRPDGTPPEVALEWMLSRRDLFEHSKFIGQAESAAEFDMAFAAGARHMIGKIDSLRDDQLNRVKVGDVLFINETYYNVQPGLKPNWKNANVGIGGNCVACYASETEGAVYTSLASQMATERFRPTLGDSIYTEGMASSDYNLIR